MTKPYSCLLSCWQVNFLPSSEVIPASHLWLANTWTHDSGRCWCLPPHHGPAPGLPEAKLDTFWARWQHPTSSRHDSLPGSFLWYSVEAPIKTTLKQWRVGVRGPTCQHSHHSADRFRSLFYPVLQRAATGTEAPMPTPVSLSRMHLLLTFLPSPSASFSPLLPLCFPGSSSKQTPYTQVLGKGSALGRNPVDTPPLLFKDLTLLQADVRDKIPEQIHSHSSGPVCSLGTCHRLQESSLWGATDTKKQGLCIICPGKGTSSSGRATFGFQKWQWRWSWLIPISGERVPRLQMAAPGPSPVDSGVFMTQVPPTDWYGPLSWFSGPLATCRASNKFHFLFQ